jgi:hypothetical protein
MTRYFLTLVALVVGFSTAGFAQAAAESALTHALSSGAGTNLGTTMGKATGRLAGRVGQQTSVVGSQKIINVKPGAPGAKTPATTPTQTGPAGSMIASIEGGENQQSNCAAAVKTEDKAAAAKAAGSGSSPTQNCVNVPTQADSHPSVVNLPAPK